MAALTLKMNKLSDSNRKTISVLLVENHSLVREGLEALLETKNNIHVVASAENGRLALQMALKHRPDVILIDIALAMLNDFEATKQFRNEVPDAKVIILSTHRDNAYVSHMVAMGATGYLLKQASFHSLANAIHEVHGGKTFFCHKVTRQQSYDYCDSPIQKFRY